MKSIVNLTLMSVLIILICSNIVFGAEEEFQLDIDNLSLEKGISTNLALTIKNAKGAEKIEIKGLDNFKVLSQSTSTQTHIVNGKVSHIKKYHYTVMPIKRGEFTLRAVVRYKGQNYETNQLHLKVNRLDKVQNKRDKNIFIKTTLTKDEIYFGEKVVLTYELFSRYNIENYGFLDNLSFNDFITQNVAQDKLKANYVYLDGKKYVKYEVKKLILTPTKTGSLKIPSYNLQVNLSTGGFFNFTEAKYFKTEKKELKVLSLPKKGKPKNFSGIVGNLNLAGQFSNQEVKYGDSVTLKVTAFGNCNLDNLNQVLEKDLTGFEIYETAKGKNEEVRNGKYHVRKSFELIIVPETSGEIKFPKLKLPYFNTESNKYEQAVIEGTKLRVIGEPVKTLTETTNSNKTIKITQINTTLGNNENYYVLRIRKSYLKISLILVVSLVVLLISFLIYKQYRFESSNELTEIYSQLKKKNNEGEIYNIFNEMIKFKYNISLKANSKREIAARINNNKLLQDIYDIMDYMEGKRFGTKNNELDLKRKVKEVYKNINHEG